MAQPSITIFRLAGHVSRTALGVDVLMNARGLMELINIGAVYGREARRKGELGALEPGTR